MSQVVTKELKEFINIATRNMKELDQYPRSIRKTLFFAQNLHMITALELVFKTICIKGLDDCHGNEEEQIETRYMMDTVQLSVKEYFALYRKYTREFILDLNEPNNEPNNKDFQNNEMSFLKEVFTSHKEPKRTRTVHCDFKRPSKMGKCCKNPLPPTPTTNSKTPDIIPSTSALLEVIANLRQPSTNTSIPSPPPPPPSTPPPTTTSNEPPPDEIADLVNILIADDIVVIEKQEK